MKKILLLIGLVAGLSAGVSAQQFITSYGFELGWGIPSGVHSIIDRTYYGYNWVHASRSSQFGDTFYTVLLQNNSGYVEVVVRNDGFIRNRFIHRNNPLSTHVCSNQCGYHSNYYTAYNGHCSSNSHYGHNHVVYYSYNKTYNHHNNSYNGKHGYQGHKKDHYQKHSQPRKVESRETYTRRDRYHDEKQNERNRPSRTSYTKTRSR